MIDAEIVKGYSDADKQTLKRIRRQDLCGSVYTYARWDDYQQDLIKAGVEKMEKGFTKYVQDRVKLWNE